VSADRPINADVESAPDADDAAAGSPGAPEAEAVEPRSGSPKREPEAEAAAEPDTSRGSEPETFDPVADARPRSAPALPPPEEPPADRDAQPSAPPPPPRRRRKGIPGAIKLVAALVLLAVGFIVLAIVAGSGGSNDRGATQTVTTTGAAPVLAAPSEPAETESESEGEGDEGAAEAPTTTAEELGYPGFATDNTTRVGGADPATIAAASALAVFPSTTAKQRPAAVTIVGEQGKPAAVIAAAASVMMAPPVRAPLLFTSSKGLPTVSVAALEALDPQGSAATDGVAAFNTTGSEALLGPGKRLDMIGAKPELPVIVANLAREREKLAGGPPDAYLVTSYDPEFAAPAAAWAARSGDPVLVTSGKKLEPGYRGILLEHKKVPVFVLGPTSAISDAVLAEVKKLGNPVKRVAGKDPVANALAFARYGAGKFGWDVNDPGHGFVLARAQDPLAAVAASALSASGTWGPLLLTDSAATLPGEVREYFLDVKPGYTTDPTRAFYNHVWVIGDQEAIDVKQQAEVNELAELAKIGEGTEG
jgi:hypothetical protein